MVDDHRPGSPSDRDRGRNRVTTNLRSPDGLDIAIDRGLAPVIQRLWEAGIDTLACCEGRGPDHEDLPGSAPDGYRFVPDPGGYILVAYPCDIPRVDAILRDCGIAHNAHGSIKNGPTGARVRWSFPSIGHSELPMRWSSWIRDLYKQ
jgi:hypothetical protein